MVCRLRLGRHRPDGPKAKRAITTKRDNTKAHSSRCPTCVRHLQHVLQIEIHVQTTCIDGVTKEVSRAFKTQRNLVGDSMFDTNKLDSSDIIEVDRTAL